LKPFLDQYIEIGDRGRLWLENAMRNGIEKMQGLMDRPEDG